MCPFKLSLTLKHLRDFKNISSPSQNQEVIRLEKSPKMAIYSPKHTQPWDDACDYGS